MIYEGEDLDGVGQSSHLDDLERLERERFLALELHQEFESLQSSRLLVVGRHLAGLSSRTLYQNAWVN